MTNIKVLHTAEAAIGGVTTYLTILNSIDTSAEDLFLVPHGGSFEEIGSDNVLTFPTYGRGFRTIFSHSSKLRKVIREEKPDVIFFHSSFSLLALLLLKLSRCKIPSIYCSHGWAVSQYDRGTVKWFLVRMIEGYLSAFADRTVNISQHDFEVAQENGYRGNHIIVENAVPEARTGAASDLFADGRENIHLLFVGRHDRQKGLDILMGAFEIVKQKRDDIRLHVIGSPIRKESMTFENTEGCDFVGWVASAEIDDYYASVDLLVVPSRWEGFGLVVPEALRNGTPALCSNRGALPTVIEAGITGDVFELSKEALAEKIMSLSHEEIGRWKSACRSVYETRFSLVRFRKDIEKLYENILDFRLKRDC